MEGTPDTSREPCPDRIIDDAGGAFEMGFFGGTVFHFLKGIKNSPKGTRFIGCKEAVIMNSPRIGGRFAVWGTTFSVFDCTMVYARQKEDPWNEIFAGFATGGLLKMRQGLRPAMRSAIWTTAFFVLIDATFFTAEKFIAQQSPPVLIEEAPPQVNTNVKTHEVLESFDSPEPPNFKFT